MNKKQIYFKSDFTVILESEAGWGGCPFRLGFYTASPSRSFVACFDGENYHNCRLLDDGRLEVAINQNDGCQKNLLGIGTLMCAPEFYLDNDAFRDHICNQFVKPFEVSMPGSSTRGTFVMNGYTLSSPPIYEVGYTDVIMSSQDSNCSWAIALRKDEELRLKIQKGYSQALFYVEGDYEPGATVRIVHACAESDENLEFKADADGYYFFCCEPSYTPDSYEIVSPSSTIELSLNGDKEIKTYGTLPAFYQKGDKGDKGDKGEQGIQGIQGEKGDKGEKGDRGEQGIQGVKGDTGATGAEGPKGETGATGPQGERGLQGEKGEPFKYSDFTHEQLEGLRGPRGYQGETGPAGPVGPQGPQGERGPKGDSVTMFPNVTIFGQPTIQESQISNFSADNYLQFPFVVDFAGRPWQIDCAITTGSNVSQQHNVLDSAFGLAFAFSGGKFVLALSSDGTSWNLGATSGTHTILANTTYYIRISWNGSVYKLAYSTDKEIWVDDITVTSSASLASKQIIIGKSLDNRYIFNGSINMSEAHLTISGKIVWEGMDDAGLATRMAIDMSNIDDEGKQRVNQIVNDGEVGQKLSELEGLIKSYDMDVISSILDDLNGTSDINGQLDELNS